MSCNSTLGWSYISQCHSFPPTSLFFSPLSPFILSTSVLCLSFSDSPWSVLSSCVGLSAADQTNSRRTAMPDTRASEGMHPSSPNPNHNLKPARPQKLTRPPAHPLIMSHGVPPSTPTTMPFRPPPFTLYNRNPQPLSQCLSCLSVRRTFIYSTMSTLHNVHLPLSHHCPTS